MDLSLVNSPGIPGITPIGPGVVAQKLGTCPDLEYISLYLEIGDPQGCPLVPNFGLLSEPLPTPRYIFLPNYTSLGIQFP